MVKVAGDGSKQILIGVLAQVRKRREVPPCDWFYRFRSGRNSISSSQSVTVEFDT